MPQEQAEDEQQGGENRREIDLYRHRLCVRFFFNHCSATILTCVLSIIIAVIIFHFSPSLGMGTAYFAGLYMILVIHILTCTFAFFTFCLSHGYILINYHLPNNFTSPVSVSCVTKSTFVAPSSPTGSSSDHAWSDLMPRAEYCKVLNR
jgi:hypothetical protein